MSHRNPPANKLPSSLTQSLLDKAIETSGYPIQQVVARKLEKNGFHVRHEWAFNDPLAETIRTADILADKWLFSPAEVSELRVRPQLDLLVECKKTRDPYVFFLTDPMVHSNVFPLTAGLNKKEIRIYTDDDPSSWIVDPVNVFGLSKHPFLSDVSGLSLNFTKANWKSGGKVELSGEDPYRSLLLPMVAAMRQFSKLEKPTSTAMYFDLHLILGVAVIDAPIVGVRIKAKGHSSSMMPWIRVMRHEPTDATRSYEHHSMLYGIDVVHIDYLEKYLETVLGPFATEFGKQAIAKQEVLRTGKGFLLGMGRDWHRDFNDVKPFVTTENSRRYTTILKRLISFSWLKA